MGWSSGACERWATLRRAALVLGLWGTLQVPGPGWADQLDPALPSLFAELKDADAVEARGIEERIWSAWFRTSDRVGASLLDEGTVLMGQRRWQEALHRFNQLVVHSPGFAEAWNKRATVHFLLGDLDDSVLDIQRTLALEPRHFGALSGLGQIYLQLDRPKAALRAFQAALAIHPNLHGVRRQVEELQAIIDGSDI
jgi:tetratricopeptide (TPR) repeat protein